MELCHCQAQIASVSSQISLRKCPRGPTAQSAPAFAESGRFRAPSILFLDIIIEERMNSIKKVSISQLRVQNCTLFNGFFGLFGLDIKKCTLFNVFVFCFFLF